MRDIIATVTSAAEHEAHASGLPGVWDGPADALRHIIGAAELRRRVGLAGAMSILEGNEIRGAFERHHRTSISMDRANNSIGLSIGADAKTFEDVVARARASVAAGLDVGGNGAGGTPRWRPRREWTGPGRPPPPLDDEPVALADRVPGANPYRFGGAEHGFFSGFGRRETEERLLADLAQVPPERRSEADVRAVIRSRPYNDSRHPSRAVWQQRVRAYFEAKAARESEGGVREGSAGEKECGGVANVRAHVRQGPNGPTQVGAHQRSVACG